MVKIFRDVRGLIPTPSYKEIISKHFRRYNQEICSTILSRAINTLEDLLKLLEIFSKTRPLNAIRPETRDMPEN